MSQRTPSTTSGRTAALITLMLVVLAAWWARAVLIPVVVAIMTAFVLAPVVLLLQRWGLRRVPAVLLVMAVTLTGVAGVSTVVGTQLLQLARDLPERRENLVRKLREVRGEGPSLFERWSQLSHELNEAMRPPDAAPTPAPVVVKNEDDTTAHRLLTYLAEPLLYLGRSTSLVFILTTSILILREDLRDRLIRLIGSGHLTTTTLAFEEAAERMGQYLRIQVGLNAAVGLLLGLGLTIIGVPYPWLWGLLTMLMRFVPVLGYWLSIVFPLLTALADEGWVKSLQVACWAGLLWAVADQVIAPRLVVRSTGISLISLVLASTFWTWLWGPIGLLLSTPITVCMAVLGKHVPALHFLDVLFGIAPPLDPRLSFYQRLVARDEGEAAERLDSYLEEHTGVELCDDLIIPALVQAGEDHRSGRLDDADLRGMVQTTGELFDELPLEEGKGATEETPLLLACGARDVREELLLRMAARLLPGGTGRVEWLPAQVMASEVIAAVQRLRPAAVLAVALPPAQVSHARYLCKRLRARFPNLPVLVFLPGMEEDVEETTKQLQAAGATRVANRLAEALQQSGTYLPLSPPAIEAKA